MFQQLFLIFLFSLGANAQVEFGPWFVRNSNGSLDLPAQVPGGIYTDLMNNEVIDDVFFGYNDVRTKWVSRENWTYYSNFTVDADLLKKNFVEIVFEGLDTFATVLINNVEVGKSINMFVRYVFPIKDVLQNGTNTIEVQFVSSILVASQLADIQNEDYKIPPQCPGASYRGECHVNQIRKMQASYSWDWGPAFPSMGIWKNFSIRGYDTNVIEYVVVDVTEENIEQWKLNIDIYYSTANDVVLGRTLLALSYGNSFLMQTEETLAVKNEHGELVHSTSLIINKNETELWWPNGYGSQPLYNLDVDFVAEPGETSSKTVTFGFRTIELVQEELVKGLSFYFKVNGVPIFMKGSNEIPIDVLPERGQNKERIRKILTAARDSHMNMLRVWGGGSYEADYFYETADEFGILLWHDFMFACAMYPANDAFISNVREEVRHQVKRLSSHPCIAAFAGSNENEAALIQNWYGTKDNFEQYKKDFLRLYIDTIMDEYLRLTHNRSVFINSSPTNGQQSVDSGYLAKNPQDRLYGDIHFYNYKLDSFNVSIYPIPRFASEYGLQGLPSLESWLTVTDNVSELNINTPFMDHRQHQPRGNPQIKDLISIQFNLPDENSENYYKAVIYYSMIIQAFSIKIESEHYRSYQNTINSDGQGRTMGALYWQLNDVWVAPTWASIDYLGKWKMLQYYATEFFAPIIVTGSINTERNVTFYAISDSLEPILNVTFELNVYKYNSTKLTPISTSTLTIDLDPTSSKIISTGNVDDLLAKQSECGDAETAKLNCFFSMILTKDDAAITPLNFLIPAKIKESSLAVPDVKITNVSYSDNGSFEITVSTDKIALFVWLEANQTSGRFSENGFIQVTNTKTISFYNETVISVEDLSEKLTITNLLDKTYL